MSLPRFQKFWSISEPSGGKLAASRKNSAEDQDMLPLRTNESIDHSDLGQQWGQRNTAGVVIASSLTFQSISHQFDDRETVSDISLSIDPGEVVCLLGPSGSGKTTLLRLAAGLLQPSKGKVLIDGREVSSASAMLPPEKRGIGLVFQDFALFPHLNIRQNVEFGLTRLGRSERARYAKLILERVGLGDLCDVYPHKLSGGEQQRVALARALAPKPGILLMDEPFSGLDARLRETVREKTLALLRDTRSTVLIVTHDPEEALEIGDKIALMRNGRLVQTGSGRQLYDQPNSLFSTRFFSEINLFNSVLQTENGVQFVNGPFGKFQIDRFAGSKISSNVPTICVRPTDFLIQPIEDNSTKLMPGYLLTKIKSRRFIGDSELFQLQIDGRQSVIHVRCDKNLVPMGSTQLAIGLDPSRAFVFD